MGKNRYRLAAIAAAIGLILGGCSAPGMDTHFRSGKLDLKISVYSAADRVERNGMRLFVDKLIEYSPSALNIQLFYEDDPMASLKSGEADIIFADSATLAQYDSDFAIYSSPFYFRDQDHMSMTLNSPTFIDLTEEDYIETLGARQLGAFYGGTMLLMTKDTPIRAVKDMEEFNLAAKEDYYTNRSLAGLFQSLEVYEDEQVAWESDEYNAVELNSAELDDMVNIDFEKAYLIYTSHRIEVNWLFVSQAFYDKLDAQHQAAIAEATAYAIAYVDGEKTSSYTENYTILQNRGVRTARFVAENLRKSGKEQLITKTDFYTAVDKSRYDAVSMIIR